MDQASPTPELVTPIFCRPLYHTRTIFRFNPLNQVLDVFHAHFELGMITNILPDSDDFTATVDHQPEVLDKTGRRTSTIQQCTLLRYTDSAVKRNGHSIPRVCTALRRPLILNDASSRTHKCTVCASAVTLLGASLSAEQILMSSALGDVSIPSDAHTSVRPATLELRATDTHGALPGNASPFPSSLPQMLPRPVRWRLDC